MKQTWIFYYETTEGKTCLFQKYDCIKPARTDVYKHLDNYRKTREDIQAWGYSILKEYVNGVKAEDIKPEKHQ